MTKFLRFIAILFLSISALFNIAGGAGTTCVAINPIGFGFEGIAQAQWLYGIFVVVTLALGIMMARAVVLLVKGRANGYRYALIAMLSAILVGVVHMLVSRSLRDGSSMPVDGVVYTTVLTLIIFLILLGLLVKFAWNPILDALDAREKRIENSVNSAENAKREAEQLVADYKAKLADAERQVARRLEEGRQMAERHGQEILDKAKEAADREREGAVRDIGLEKQRALAEIRSEAVGISRMIAEKAISRELNAEDHRRLADEILAAMK